MKSKRVVVGAVAALLAVTTLGAATDRAEEGAAPEQVPVVLATEGLLTQNRVKATVTWKSPSSGQSATVVRVPAGSYQDQGGGDEEGECRTPDIARSETEGSAPSRVGGN